MSDYKYNNTGNEDDDDDSRDDTDYTTQKDAILFAIDISDSMVAQPSSDEMDIDPPKKKRKLYPSAIAALQCAYDVMLKRIISNPNDMIGILLFGTEKSKFSGDMTKSYPNCYLLLDLDIPAAENIKEIKNLLEDEDEMNDVVKPSKERPDLGNVLFGANHLFTTKAANFNSRRLFLITDNDNPHEDDANRKSGEVSKKNTAITRAKDLYDLGVRIEPFFIAKQGENFDKTKFYDDIVYKGEDDSGNAVSSNAMTRFEDMRNAITAKQAPRRALMTSRIELAPNLQIGVKGYLLYKRLEPSRSHYIYEGGEKLKTVKGTTTRLNEETAQEVTPAEVRKAYKFGGEAISFTDEEIKKIRYFGEPIIRVIGFKPMKYLEVWHNVKHATFLYPSEDEITGSTRTFAALHQKLLKDEIMGLVWYVARRNAAPVLCAMVASAEKIDDGKQTVPPGLFLIQLPFMDDIRQDPEVSLLVAPGPLIDKMRDIIRQLHKPNGYNPSKYSNPALQKHYKILQAIALEEELPEHFEDQTIPKYKLIDKHLGNRVAAWGDELETAYKSQPESDRIQITGKKRLVRAGSASAESSTSFKKVKKEEGSDDVMSDKEMKALFMKNGVGKLTVAVLKEWLQSKGLEKSGVKADLVERVETYFETK